MAYVAPKELAGIVTEVPEIKDIGGAADAVLTSIETPTGTLNVEIQGDLKDPILVTYHDIGLDHNSCFAGLMNYPGFAQIKEMLCVIHIDAPGQTPGSPVWPIETPYPTMDELADQIGAVLDHYKITKRILGMGAGAGGQVLTRFAIGYPSRVQGLILIGSSPSAAGWIEWGYSKAARWSSTGLGIAEAEMTPLACSNFLTQYFGSSTQANNKDLMDTYTDHLTNKMTYQNIAAWMTSYESREEIFEEGDGLMIKANTMMIYGSESWDKDGIVDKFDRFDPSGIAKIEVEGCGNMVHEEQPAAVCEPIRLYLEGLGYINR